MASTGALGPRLGSGDPVKGLWNVNRRREAIRLARARRGRSKLPMQMPLRVQPGTCGGGQTGSRTDSQGNIVLKRAAEYLIICLPVLESSEMLKKIYGWWKGQT